jgi:hypothetical protein
MQSLILALAALVLGGSPGGVHAESGAAEFDDSCHKGTFSSETYLYSIALPEGMQCCHDPAPNPVHGCSVIVPGTKGGRLWVDGSYNVLSFNSAEDALYSAVGSDLVAGTTLKVLRRETARLGGFEAVRLTLRIVRQGDESRVKDWVLAIGPRKGREEIVYTVALDAPEAEYSQYEKIFSQIVSSWKAKEPQ